MELGIIVKIKNGKNITNNGKSINDIFTPKEHFYHWVVPIVKAEIKRYNEFLKEEFIIIECENITIKKNGDHLQVIHPENINAKDVFDIYSDELLMFARMLEELEYIPAKYLGYCGICHECPFKTE